MVREEFENGRVYYALHGNRIVGPEKEANQPDVQVPAWYNERIHREWEKPK